MKKVYLAGAMEFAHDGGVDWRRDLTVWLGEKLGHEALDPTVLEHDQLTNEERNSIAGLKLTDLGQVRELSRRIVHYDLDIVINQADYLVVVWNEATQRGCGTAGEITVATWVGKPVYLLLDYPREQASTWMVACTTAIFHSWEELQEALLHDFKEDRK